MMSVSVKASRTQVRAGAGGSFQSLWLVPGIIFSAQPSCELPRRENWAWLVTSHRCCLLGRAAVMVMK